jgi:hypothetical protein
MALLTLAEFKSYLQIDGGDDTYDAAFAVYEPVVCQKVDDLCHRVIEEDLEDETLSETRLGAYKPVFAQMVLWEIGQNTVSATLRTRIKSKVVGKLSVTPEELDPRTGYPKDIMARLSGLRRPKKI